MNKFNLLKYLSKWKYLIFAVCVLGALIVYKYAMYNQEYTASTVISYTGQNAADGKTPSGDDIDVTEIYSAAVITNVLEDLNLNIGADAIRSKCKVTEIIPPDEEVKEQALLEAGEEYTYFPTDYVVSFSVGSEYSQDFARTVLDSIIKNYFATYGEKYINQQTLPNSSTFYVLNDVSSAEVPDDPNERIDAGELILTFDGSQYKIGRGVNSLTSFTATKTEDFRKIKIVEGMDLYMDDIRDTFEKYYVGKVINDYDNKQMFVAAISSYHKELLGDVLDRSYDNTVSVDVDAQRNYLEGRGTDTSEMDDTAVAEANTGSKVFVTSNVKFVDAMEDLKMTVNM